MREGLSVFSSGSGQQAKGECAGHTPHDDFRGQQPSSASPVSEESITGSMPHGGIAGSVVQDRVASSIPLERVVSSVLREEMTDFLPQEGVARCFPPQRLAGSIPVAAYGSGRDELETSADTLETSAETCSTDDSPALSDGSDWSARSSVPHPHRWEAEKMPDAHVTATSRKNVMQSKGGLNGLSDDPDMALVSRGLSDMDGQDGGVAAPDWLDVTHAMLSAIDDANPASM